MNRFQQKRAYPFPLIFWSTICVVLLSVFSLAGCGGKSPTGSAVGEKGGEALPALDSPLPPLDDGRIEVAGPKGWHYPPRSAKYVFRVQKSQNAPVPLIALTAEAAEDLADLTPQTVNAFISQLAERQKREPTNYRVIDIGGRRWVAYRTRGRQPGRVGEVLDILALETVVAGRRYTLRLVCEPGTIPEWEPYLRAVAAGMRFLKTGELLASAEPKAVDASEKPAAEEVGPAKAAEGVPPLSPTEPAAEKPAAKPSKPAAPADKPKAPEPELDLESLEELLR